MGGVLMTIRFAPEFILNKKLPHCMHSEGVLQSLYFDNGDSR